MFNSIEAYQERGERAAVAQNQQDQGRVNSERDHYQRMIQYEAKPQDYETARAAFQEAYSNARIIGV